MKSSVVSLEGKLLFSDDGVGVHRFWIRSHWWWSCDRWLRSCYWSCTDKIESFPSTDVSLSVNGRTSTSGMNSQVSTMNASEADCSISVSDQVIGFPGANLGLKVDSDTLSSSRVGSDEGVVESSESDLSVAQVEQSELLPGSDGGLDVYSGSLSSRMGSGEGSVVSPQGKLFFSDDSVRTSMYWSADATVSADEGDANWSVNVDANWSVNVDANWSVNMEMKSMWSADMSMNSDTTKAMSSTTPSSQHSSLGFSFR